METVTLIIGSLQTNCYLVYDKKSKETIIIDPAGEGEFIIQKILDLKLKPVGIIATHGHFDHLLAASDLRLNLQIPFLMHQADLFLLKSIESRTKYWTGLKSDPPIIPDHFIDNGDILTINNGLQISKQINSSFALCTLHFEIISTPGHTPGSICLYHKGEYSSNVYPEQQRGEVRSSRSRSNNKPILFSGDTLFKEGVGRTDYSYSSKKDLVSSIKEKIFTLPENTAVYPGHGMETSIGDEKNAPISRTSLI